MTCRMSPLITIHKDLSNELSWAQFGVQKDLQTLTETTLCILATSFYTFWTVLGDWSFDRANELQIEKLKMFWKLYLTIFQMIYPTPNLDIRKASRGGFQKGVALWEGGTELWEGGTALLAVALCFSQWRCAFGRKARKASKNSINLNIFPLFPSMQLS